MMTLNRLLFVALSTLILSSVVKARVDIDSFCSMAIEQAGKSKIAESNNGNLPDPHEEDNEDTFVVSIEERFYGCKYHIKWMQQARKEICIDKTMRLDLIEAPKYMFFVFDGMGDFNARHAYGYAENINGSEGRDLGMGTMNGGRVMLPQISSLKLKEEGERKSILYYSGSGFHPRENYSSAIKCAQEVDDYFNVINELGRNHEAKWSVLGFSNGAKLAIEFQNYLADDLDINVDLVFTVDPISQVVAYIFSDFFDYAGERNKQTSRFINFYQTDDFNSSSLSLKLRGKPVKNALNIRLSSLNSSHMNSSGYLNHVNIVNSTAVKTSLKCELDILTGLSKTAGCMEDYRELELLND